MSQIERSERGNRHGQRRKHHRWSGPDHLHHDGRSHVFQHYDGLKSSRMVSRPTPLEDRHTPMLDELTLEHMTQDCSLLKNQLLRLKMLLQLEDAESPADVPEEIEESTTASQMDTLIKEVQVLREELRSRDKTIAQLTIQCQQLQQQHRREQTPAQGRPMRCQCHHQRAPSSMRHGDRQMDKRTQHHYDKATQTYWRPPNHTPRILQPSSPRLNEHLHKERLVKTPHIVGLSNLTRSRSEEAAPIDAERPLQALVVDRSGPAGPAELSHPPSSSNPHCLDSGAPQGITAREGPASSAQSATQREPRAQILHSSITPGSAGTTCPRMLQPPRLHKRLSLPALKPGGTGGFASPKPGCFLGPLANQSKQLPPPSRGLPCFNTGPQVQSPSPCRTSLLQPRRISQPCRDPRSHSSASEEPSQGTLKDAGSAKTLNPLSRSCLPKPKIP